VERLEEKLRLAKEDAARHRNIASAAKREKVHVCLSWYIYSLVYDSQAGIALSAGLHLSPTIPTIVRSVKRGQLRSCKPA
jgi:hypothetical protein